MSESNQKKAKRFYFSKTRVEALKPLSKGRQYYYDEQTPGLAVCVHPSGTKTLYYIKKVEGRPDRHKIGRFPEVTVEQARNEAKKLAGKIACGEDPLAAKRANREAPTLQNLFDHWLESARHHKKTWEEDVRKWNKHFTEFKNLKIKDISIADVSKWHNKLGSDNGRCLANRAIALLSSMYGKAHELGYDGPNPCKGVRKFAEKSRERFLQEEEMGTFLSSIAEEPQQWHDFWRISLFTGARSINVKSMAWTNLDLQLGVWHLSGDKTKNGASTSLVLTPKVVEILQARKESCGDSEWVFPAKSSAGHIKDSRKSWARVTERAGIKNLKPHDLRRTLGSWQAIQGTSLPIIGASLGHKDMKSTAIYSRLTPKPVRESIGSVGEAFLEAGARNRTHAEQDSTTQSTEEKAA